MSMELGLFVLKVDTRYAHMLGGEQVCKCKKCLWLVVFFFHFGMIGGSTTQFNQEKFTFKQ